MSEWQAPPPSVDVTPQHQFGFPHSHSTIQQCHTVVHEINKTVEKENIVPPYFST
jgi:hypothetical protein